MTTSPDDRSRLARLRALLAGPRAAATFGEILLVLRAWPAGPARESATDEAEAALAAWPDEERRAGPELPAPAPSWARLIRTLSLFASSGAREAPRLAREPALAGLTGLIVHHREDSEDDSHLHLGVLARSPCLRSIRRLEVRAKYTYPGEWAEVAASPVFSRLDDLRLWRLFRPLTVGELEAVLRGPGRALRRLALSVSPGSVATLTAVDSLTASLRDLTLDGPDAPHIEALIEARSLCHLDELELREASLPGDLRARLQRAPQFARTRLRIDRSEWR